MDPALVGQIQTLLDQYGWADFLVALDAVARADGFLPLADALDPIHHLVHENGEKPPAPQ